MPSFIQFAAEQPNQCSQDDFLPYRLVRPPPRDSGRGVVRQLKPPQQSSGGLSTTKAAAPNALGGPVNISVQAW
jgi:hypothetical protein